MPDLSTTWMGLRVRNPLIAGSCGLTGTPDGLRALEAGGVGAVVLKSIFEEEIAAEYDDAVSLAARKGMSLESYDYYDYELRGQHLAEYVKLIGAAKKAVSVPVIASVNCTWSHEWTSFAKDIEAAGADGLELNMFFLPSDTARSAEEQEKDYLGIIERVRGQLGIPLALKIGSSFTNLAQMIVRLSGTGAAGLVLFNRFYSLDFDIEKMAVTGTGTLSSPAEIAGPLRWIALMSRRVACDLAASTGVHDGQGMIKMILAGARVVQAASCFYRNGAGWAAGMLGELSAWMDRHGFRTVDDFRGRLSQAESVSPGVYERVQYMKHYAEDARR
jgi:dihydroorotate dehydrogenase (fumarate)